MPTVVKKPNGLCYIRVRVRDENHEQHETTVPTGLKNIHVAISAMPRILAAWERERTEEAALAAAAEEAAGAEIAKASVVTLGQYLRQWLADNAPRLREQTVDNYRWLIETRLIPYLGAIPIDELKRRDIREHLEAEAGRPKARGTGVLSPRTIQMERNLLHKALADAVGDEEDDGLLSANPVAKVRVPKVPRHNPRSMTQEQALAFLAAASESRNHALWVMAVTTGARIGELLGLRWEDVDLGRGDIYIATTLQTRKTPKRGAGPKRESSRRRVSLGPSVVDVLRRHQEAQRALVGASGGLWRDPGIVFPNTEGGYQQLSNLERHSETVPEPREDGKRRRKPTIGDYARVLRRAGLPWFRPHDLRHTMATLALARGQHIKVVQERLGHSSVRTTLEMYAGVLPGMDVDLAGWLDGLVPMQNDALQGEVNPSNERV